MLGWTYKCKGWETAPNAYAYVVIQRPAKEFALSCKGLGFEDRLTNPDFNTADARDKHKDQEIARIQSYRINKDKYEVTADLLKFGIPVGHNRCPGKTTTDRRLNRFDLASCRLYRNISRSCKSTFYLYSGT